jgi:hypothetical protein
VECEGRRLLLLLSHDASLLASTLLGIVSSNESNQEIELNLVMWKQASDLVVALFPRGGHRPRCFYRTGQDHMLISPGSMEMAGLVVVPRLEDWNRVTADDMREIYREVCLADTAWQRFLARLEISNDN